MADGPDKEEKTEEATGKRLEEAFSRGETPIAREVRHAVMFVGMLVVLGGLGSYTVQRVIGLCANLWGNADDYRITPEGGQAFATGLLGALGTALLPIMATLVGFALLGGILQGRPSISWSRVKPKFSKLNPVAGFQRTYNMMAVVEFAKTLTKLCVIVGIAASVAWPHIRTIDQLTGADLGEIGIEAAAISRAMLIPIALLVGALAAFDYFYQRHAFFKRLRMTKQEVKDEHKQSEGDPVIKGKIRAMQRQRAKQRMMSNVPKASVIITNPTHYAVALQYDHGAMAAPVVVAKGVDAVALRIREIAGEHNIPLVENRPLARALYASADLDRPIPVEHYAAVAEVISYVMRIARNRR